ncbi:hypothetical protein CHUAL_014067 [Chamberlinius hualienensis]
MTATVNPKSKVGTPENRVQCMVQNRYRDVMSMTRIHVRTRRIMDYTISIKITKKKKKKEKKTTLGNLPTSKKENTVYLLLELNYVDNFNKYSIRLILSWFCHSNMPTVLDENGKSITFLTTS